jgi:hypothetical protein
VQFVVAVRQDGWNVTHCAFLGKPFWPQAECSDCTGRLFSCAQVDERKLCMSPLWRVVSDSRGIPESENACWRRASSPDRILVRVASWRFEK